MTTGSAYKDFLRRMKLFMSKNPSLIITTLSNIFTMRLIGNKTHGDLAEIAISEFINQFIYDYSSVHVGKDLFRAKSAEEDISVKSELDGIEIPISLKAYGKGPLQLSTDKTNAMWDYLERKNKSVITAPNDLRDIFQSQAFSNFSGINVLPLIYDEGEKRCNIMIFDYDKAASQASKVTKIIEGGGRVHPIYKFEDNAGHYIFEVRYGGASANALQRGLWTHTERAAAYFDSITGGWVDYSHNLVLVDLFSKALIVAESAHKDALKIVNADIDRLTKQGFKDCQ